MRRKINSKVLLSNVFNIYDDKTYVDINFLDKVAKKIYNQLKNFPVYIDISTQSIYETVESNPKLFTWHGSINKISKARKSKKYFKDDYIKENINVFLPPKITAAFNIIKSSKSKLVDKPERSKPDTTRNEKHFVSIKKT